MRREGGYVVRLDSRFLVALATLVAAAARPAAADDLAKLDTSLKLIPADAAFYSSMLRNREQFQAINAVGGRTKADCGLTECHLLRRRLSEKQAQLK